MIRNATPLLSCAALAALLCGGPAMAVPPLGEGAPVLTAGAADSARAQPTLTRAIPAAASHADTKPSAPLASEPAPAGAIMLNQHGFIRSGPKRAITRRSGGPVPFTVVNSRQQEVFRGMSERVRGLDPQSAMEVHRLDFSALDLAGEGFTVRLGGIPSDPFSIGQRPYQALARDSLNYFYQSRFAEPVEASYVPARTPALTRPAGHLDSTYGCFAGTDTRGTVWPGCDYQLTVRGGWYDAGDYGQYAVNTGVAAWAMLNMAERAKATSPRVCRPVLGDGALPLPEAGNGTPDILDEARRGIDNLLSTQVVSSTPQALARGNQAASGALRLTQTDASGMVHHKVHGIRWPGDDILHQTDTIPRRLYPPTTIATLTLAGVGGQCARVFRGVDPAYARTCLSAAERAYAAAKRVPDAYAWGEFDGGGPYDDRTATDEFGWAATELWLATGKAEYRADMDRFAPGYDVNAAFDWRNVAARGIVSIATQPNLSGARADLARDGLRRWADRYAAEGQSTHFAFPYADRDFYWGSAGQVALRGVILGTAHDALGGDRTGGNSYRNAVIDAADYLLGRNALSRSFVSGYGERPMRNPHHRFWRGGSDPSLPLPPPGVLSGGPNNTSFVDPVGSTLRGQCVGMTCWRDEYPAYSLNEVAINWNAALAWTAHWLDRQSVNCSGQPRDSAAYK